MLSPRGNEGINALHRFIAKFGGFELELEIRLAIELEGQAKEPDGERAEGLGIFYLCDGQAIADIATCELLAPEGDIVGGDREVAGR